MQQEKHSSEKNLHDIAIEGDSDALVAFLDDNPNVDVNALDEYVGLALLHLRRRAILELNNTSQGFTPLHLSSDRGNISVVRVLLKRGADVSIKVCHVLCEKCPPIHCMLSNRTAKVSPPPSWPKNRTKRMSTRYLLAMPADTIN